MNTICIKCFLKEMSYFNLWTSEFVKCSTSLILDDSTLIFTPDDPEEQFVCSLCGASPSLIDADDYTCHVIKVDPWLLMFEVRKNGYKRVVLTKQNTFGSGYATNWVKTSDIPESEMPEQMREIMQSQAFEDAFRELAEKGVP